MFYQIMGKQTFEGTRQDTAPGKEVATLHSPTRLRGYVGGEPATSASYSSCDCAGNKTHMV